MRLHPPAFLLPLIAFVAAAAHAAPLQFSFGSRPPQPDFVQVLPDTAFTPERGFGFEAGASVAAAENGVVSDKPFYFSAAVPTEGNYRIAVTVPGGTDVTIKAELRRLMVERLESPPGRPNRRVFIVNTRTPKIAATGNITAGIVRLKAPRETTQEAWAWDNLLTLEFNGTKPAVLAIEIEPASVPTIFLIGDSTVCDQSKEPYNSWGQMLTRFFKPEVAIANHGESGETYRDSIGRRRLDKMLSVMKPGDWLLMQFGHNDQKQIAAGSGSPATYRDEIKQHVDAVRAHGGTPVILSPMERRGFDEAGKVRPSLIDYADAARQAAKDLRVAFIDLNAMSKSLYEALGRDKSALAFAAPEGRVDNTHHNNFGSHQLAQCIVQAIRDQKLPIAKFIVDDFKGFDPARPDDPEKFDVPSSPNYSNQRPLGDEANK